MLHWLKVYLSSLPEIVDDGRLYEEQGAKVAKGLKYSIKALEDSRAQWRKEKRKAAEDGYQAAVSRFGV